MVCSLVSNSLSATTMYSTSTSGYAASYCSIIAVKVATSASVPQPIKVILVFSAGVSAALSPPSATGLSFTLGASVVSGASLLEQPAKTPTSITRTSSRDNKRFFMSFSSNQSFLFSIQTHFMFSSHEYDTTRKSLLSIFP